MKLLKYLSHLADIGSGVNVDTFVFGQLHRAIVLLALAVKAISSALSLAGDPMAVRVRSKTNVVTNTAANTAAYQWILLALTALLIDIDSSSRCEACIAMQPKESNDGSGQSQILGSRDGHRIAMAADRSSQVIRGCGPLRTL